MWSGWPRASQKAEGAEKMHSGRVRQAAVPACLKHSGASPGKARCSELIAIDAQSNSPHDPPDVLGCAWMRLPAQEVHALFDSRLRAARVKL